MIVLKCKKILLKFLILAMAIISPFTFNESYIPVINLVFATNIDENNIQGLYSIEAKVAKNKYKLRAEFLPNKLMNLVLPDDRRQSICNGEFSLSFESFQDAIGDFIYAQVIRSDLLCSRLKDGGAEGEREEHKADLTIVIKEYTLDALNDGTWVTVSSSLAKGHELPAKMKKIAAEQN